MKQTLILRIYIFSSFIIYLSTNIIFYFINNNIYPLWFSLACLLISLYCILKGLFFALDSSLWLGLFLLGTSFIGIINIIFNLDILNILTLIFIFATLSSIIVAISYKNFLLFKISFLLSLETILILMYTYKIIGISIFSFLSALIVVLMLYKFYSALKINNEKN